LEEAYAREKASLMPYTFPDFRIKDFTPVFNTFYTDNPAETGGYGLNLTILGDKKTFMDLLEGQIRAQQHGWEGYTVERIDVGTANERLVVTKPLPPYQINLGVYPLKMREPVQLRFVINVASEGPLEAMPEDRFLKAIGMPEATSDK